MVHVFPICKHRNRSFEIHRYTAMIPVPEFNIKIERKSITFRDNPKEIIIDGRACSLTFATDMLLCSGPYNHIERFPYYTWDENGLFRSTAGKFKWYFALRDTEPNYQCPCEVSTTFKQNIDYEHDSIDFVFLELRDRVETAREALAHYDPANNIFKKLNKEELERYLYQPLDGIL